MTGVVSMALYHCHWLVFGAEIFLFIRFFTLDKHPFIELIGGGGESGGGCEGGSELLDVGMGRMINGHREALCSTRPHLKHMAEMPPYWMG